MVVVRTLAAFHRDQTGAAMVEWLIVVNIVVLVLVAFVEFSFAVNQWNLAAKAVQAGARIAAVSDPIDPSIPEWTGLDESMIPPVEPGDPIRDTFRTVCSGATGSCTCTGTKPTGCGYDAAAMNKIVYGSGWRTQDCSVTRPRLGMCGVLAGGPTGGIRPENVIVEYAFTGLGYAGRPGGPVPTVTVSLVGLHLDLPILGRVLGLNQITLPPFTTTTIGEDLSSAAPL